jgi:lactoylglutathione lyase
VSTRPCTTRAQIEHIALVTDDIQGLRDFYLRLGAVPVPSANREIDPHSSAVDFCGIRLELFERERGHPGDDHSAGVLHLGFALESADAVDALSSALAAAGHVVVEPPHRIGELGRYECVVLDPDGNRVKLIV